MEEAVSAYLAQEGSVKDIGAAVHALKWVGIIEDSAKTAKTIAAAADFTGSTPLDALCVLLEARLQLAGERDMVAMYHTVVGRFPDGRVE